MTVEGQSQARSSQGPAPDARRARHGQSRMLESYLNDIEYLMRERLWNEAVPLALALPHICSALADPQLRSSPGQYLQWCHDWVRPLRADTALLEVSPEDILAMSRAGVHEPELDDGVPSTQLRQLRLRRLSRASPPRRRQVLTDLVRADAAEEADREAAIAVIDAVRRWYREQAVLDSTVQGNLGRLAILR